MSDSDSDSDGEHRSPTLPDAPDTSPDETLDVTSLKPATRGFSQRRLLNVASVAVAGVVLLALAIHWQPDVIPAPTIPTPTETLLRIKTPTPVPTSQPRGAGWKAIGPGWAQDIAFSANGALGYACGTLGPGAAPVNFAVYDPTQNVWNRMATISSGERCRVSVSPSDASDVALVTYNCIVCDNITPTAQVFRSHDGGGAWAPVHVPVSLIADNVAWTNSALFVVAEGVRAPDNSLPFHLLVSRMDGPLAEISARQLLGHSAQLIGALLVSSGSTVYATLAVAPCSVNCLTLVRSSDDGRHWTRVATSYPEADIGQTAAQPGADTLVTWVFPQQSPSPTMLRSTDKGAHWQELPTLPSADILFAPDTLSVLPDGSIILWSIGPANSVYMLRDGATTWQRVATMPVGTPLTVQYDADGHAVALWGLAHNNNPGDFTPGLEYYPLPDSAP
jgi:hypothetical protein